MSPTRLLRDRHAQCECLIGDTMNGVVNKHGCRLTIHGLQIATDCDRCRAFDDNTKKPDIVAIQRCGSSDDYRWLVVEIKGVMDTDARRQAESGLETIAKHGLFAVSIKRARVCFAFKQRDLRRTADQQKLRKSFKWRGTTVPVLVRRCGRTIPQRWR